MKYLWKTIHIFVEMGIQNELKHQLEAFSELCRNHNVKYLYAFGSSVNDQFNPETSDIDLLVEMNSEDPMERGEQLMDLWDKFEIFFQRKVDLLTDSSIKNPILRKSIDKSKVLIYDGPRNKILI